MQTPKPNSSAEARGLRLRLLRQALRLSRIKLASGCDVSTSTIQSWESARYGGLTESGARNLSQYFTSLGLVVSEQWLFYGIGEDPLQGGVRDVVVSTSNKPTSQHEAILKELQLFRVHCNDAIDLIVPDDALAPFIKRGDLVAGKRIFGNEIQTVLEKIAIVQLTSGETVVRQISASNVAHRYNLSAFNKEKIIGAEIFSAAVVIWWRRIG